MKWYKVILKSKKSDFGKLSSVWQKLASQNQVEQSLALQIEVCLDEIFTNIVSYAYSDDEEHEIEVRFNFGKEQLRIEIEDDGASFDPTRLAEPELKASLEERPIGGLGIHLVKKIMDNLIYERKNNKNILILQKYL